MAEWIDFMPGLRRQARNHPDMVVRDDGSVTLKEDSESANIAGAVEGEGGYLDD